MSLTKLGHVPSLFPHIKDEWWKDAHSKTLLWTDSPNNRRMHHPPADPKVHVLFSAPNSSNAKVEVQVLDPCCSQGRHKNTLAASFYRPPSTA
ncbi:hypothetical protein ASPSYDRAFT_543003 [Aspergillus sydowii CBS 593.65]|uniref:Uncharacterized protein n=1 Tax=Aspergillus sydowii CBS 593.65 TaxID=1036612 RepID=A0A1L9T128_9EURO|nr:uncharacterized protein ASPSYDRAFT_543003 [Aspergillus sydowii CBS 593.65]OJJ53109.1 hypothetical protein ASPSYDRAFT_543003 [Aspergillus sydowii CBS 593.65]